MPASRPALGPVLAALALGGLVALAPGSPLRGQSGELLSRPEVRQAMLALQEGHPELAVDVLDKALETAPPGAPDEAALPLARLRLEAVARLGDWARVRSLGEQAPLAGDGVGRFWRALALVQTGEPDAAALLLAPLAEDAAFPLRSEAMLNLASLHVSRGDYRRAMEEMDGFTSRLAADAPARLRLELRAAEWTLNQGLAEDAALRLGKLDGLSERLAPESRALLEALMARLAAFQGKRDEAVDTLQRLAAQPDVSAELREKAGWWLAQLDSDTAPESARDRLVALIETHPRSVRRDRYFDLLETLLARRPDPRIQQALARWSADASEPQRQWQAGYLLASAPGSSAAEREKRLLAFARAHVPAPAGLAALFEAGQVAIADARAGEALQHADALRAIASPQARSLADSLTARAHFARGDLPAAAEAMEAAARAADVPRAMGLAHQANAALAAALSGQRKQAAKWAQTLAQTAPLEATGSLAYEVAMNAAARGEPEAFDALADFARKYPSHPLVAEAEMAQAELHLNQVPPRAIAARERLEAARRYSLTPAQKERADYIAVWVESADDHPGEAQRLAQAFLQTWPGSAQGAGITLLLGELYFRTGDHRQAHEWFLRHAQNYPRSPQVEAAQFFAAQAAWLTRGDEGERQATELWQALAARRGPYAAAAQHELGLLHLSRERFAEAVAAFDAVLLLQPAPELRFAALCDRGQALVSRAQWQGGQVQADLEQAMASFAQVEEEPSVPRSWRLQAAVRRGRCLERLGRPAEALTAYQSALSLPPGGLADRILAVPVEESDWFYRAGFGAIRLLDTEKRHREAVEVAEILAASRGGRALEAGELATDIRLRHFLWEIGPGDTASAPPPSSDPRPALVVP